MKATGIVRPVDDCGRFGIPAKLRRTMNIEKKDDMEIYVENGMIILTKHAVNCVFCHSEQNLRDYQGRHVCDKCLCEICQLK